MPTSAENFSSFGVGAGDEISYRIIDYHIQRFVNGTSLEFRDDDFSFYDSGHTLKSGDEFQVKVGTLKKITDSDFLVYGDYIFDGQIIVSDVYLREVHHINWDIDRIQFTTYQERFYDNPMYFDVSIDLTENDEIFRLSTNYSTWESVLGENVTTTRAFIQEFSKSTGTILYSFDGFYYQYTNANHEHHFEEQIIEILQLGFDAADDSSFKIFSPGNSIVAVAFLTVIIGREKVR